MENVPFLRGSTLQTLKRGRVAAAGARRPDDAGCSSSESAARAAPGPALRGLRRGHALLAVRWRRAVRDADLSAVLLP
eukprot:SAG22_NODE_11626_length_476_cov_0.976127_1_plen_77_part_01